MWLIQFHNIYIQNMKSNTCMGVKKKRKHKNYFIHTKVRKENTNCTYNGFAFLAIFYEFQ